MNVMLILAAGAGARDRIYGRINRTAIRSDRTTPDHILNNRCSITALAGAVAIIRAATRQAFLFGGNRSHQENNDEDKYKLAVAPPLFYGHTASGKVTMLGIG